MWVVFGSRKWAPKKLKCFGNWKRHIWTFETQTCMTEEGFSVIFIERCLINLCGYLSLVSVLNPLTFIVAVDVIICVHLLFSWRNAVVKSHELGIRNGNIFRYNFENCCVDNAVRWSFGTLSLSFPLNIT